MRHAGRMLVKAILSLHRAALVAALAVALVATGIGHRLPSDQEEALAFALANGLTAQDFCGDMPGDAAKTGLHCLACQITGGSDLPSAVQLQIDHDLTFAATSIVPRESRALARVLDPGRLAQGPPTA